MKSSMATKQKRTATGAVKTSETVRLRSGPLPVYRVLAKSLIDPSEFIPIIDGKKSAGGGVKLLRRVDLFPKKVMQLPEAGKFNIGQTLLDVFSPSYGSSYFWRPPYFSFSFSRLLRTDANLWWMAFLNSPTDNCPVLDQELWFLIDPRGLQPTTGAIGSYVNIPLGETNCILTVKINNTEFNLDLSNRSNQFFDLWLIDNSTRYYLGLKLPSAQGVGKVCIIKQVELYDTIRVLPPVISMP